MDTYTSVPAYQGSAGLFPTRLSNSDYGWEINKKLEFALDLGFLNNQILFSGSYYRNRSTDLLVGYALPPTAGFASIQYNLPATVQNSGWEFELSTINLKNKSFTWNTSINLTIPRNKLVSYPNLEASPYSNTYVIGEPLTILKSFHYIGVDPTTGLINFQDANDDGAISFPKDAQTIKNIDPNYYGGFQNNFKYKEFELNIFFQFVKQNGRNYLSTFSSPPGFLNNQPSIVMQRWQKIGDVTSIQKFTQNYSSLARAAYRDSRFYGDNVISDASFIRLKNLSLSYQLGSKLNQKLHLQKSIIYVQGQNLFTITKYEGIDPENNGANRLPPLRMLTAGIQVTL